MSEIYTIDILVTPEGEAFTYAQVAKDARDAAQAWAVLAAEAGGVEEGFVDSLRPLIDNLPEVLEVQSDLTQIKAVQEKLAEIQAVHDTLANIDIVAGDTAAINALFGSISELLELYTELSKLLELQGNLTDLTTLHDYIPNFDIIIANLQAIIDVSVIAGIDEKVAIILEAEEKAQAWADEDEDVEVETDPDQYSAKHHALKAAASAATISPQSRVKSWATAEAFEIDNITYSASGNISGADLVWPDGVTGTISDVTEADGLITSIRYNYDAAYVELSITYDVGEVEKTEWTINGF